MNPSLSKLLLAFEWDCRQSVREGIMAPKEGQVILQLIEFPCFQANTQEHNNNLQAIQHEHVPQSIDGMKNFDNQKSLFQNSKGVDQFLKCKHKIQEAPLSQNIRKTSKKYSRKYILTNEKTLQPDNSVYNTKSYKPNTRMANLFKKIKKHNDFFQYQSLSITQEENQNLFKKLKSLTLKSNEVKQKPQFIQYSDENQKKPNLYKVNPNLMAPKKQKLKKVKSNQPLP